MRLHGNLTAMYEYCNLYFIIVAIGIIAKGDLGFITEVATRFLMLSLMDFYPYWVEIIQLFEKPIPDWYLIGYRTGMSIKLMMDVKLR